MKNYFKFLFLFLFIFQSVLSEDVLRARKVSKTGDVEIPEGMHLINSRTGEKWLLPIGEDTPPDSVREVDYYKTKTPGTKTTKFNGQQAYTGPLNSEDIFVADEKFWGNLPPHFKKLLLLEKDMNLHGQSDHFSFLGDFGPNSKKSFHIPYIPIPVDDMEFGYVSEHSKPETKKFIIFEKDGKKFYRFFIHPNYPDSYAELIKKHGIVYHYVAATTSSPRSLIVVDPEVPGEVHWVKPSLPKKIDGSVRLNIDTKLRRAVIMSEALANIPSEAKAKYGVDFMIEPASLQPKGKTFGTIFRELNEELLFPGRGKSFIPAFALNAPEANGKTMLQNMIEKSNKGSSDFIQNDIIRPFLKSYLSLALIEGLPGEFHTQNFYYEVKDGLPTGKFIFKDNDGFRFDVELAMRNDRKLDYLSKFEKPFYWAKFSNALGTGAEGVPFLGSWYYKLIRNVNGFETLSSYILDVVKDLNDINWDKDQIQRIFDDIVIEEATKITGVEIDAESKYGFGPDNGVNKILNLHRKNLSEAEANVDFWKNNEGLQAELRAAFDEAVEDKAVHARGSVGARSYFVPHLMDDNTLLIEARSSSPRGKYKNPTQALAIFKKESVKANAIKDKIPGLLNQCLRP